MTIAEKTFLGIWHKVATRTSGLRRVISACKTRVSFLGSLV